MGKTIKAIIKKPKDKIGSIKEIPNTVRGIQEAVGGYFEVVAIRPGLCLLCDEEGKIKRLKPNVILKRDIIVGPVVIVGSEGEDFTDCPISLDEWKEMIGA